MKAEHQQIADLIRRDGLIRRSEHPELSNQIGWLARSGRLVPVLQDCYVAATRRSDPDVLILATGRALPKGILTSDAAARLGYAPDHRVDTVAVALGHRRRDVPGYRFSQRRIPAELVTERDRIRLTMPALTALDLTETSGGEAIDEVLRRRAATLAGLRQALDLSANRRGNRRRGELLLDSRDEPWSAAERKFHRILRLLGYTSWRANYRVVLGARTCYLDVAFPAQRVAIEIDGRCSTPIRRSSRATDNGRIRSWPPAGV